MSASHVAIAQDSANNAVGMKRLEGIPAFADAEELIGSPVRADLSPRRRGHHRPSSSGWQPSTRTGRLKSCAEFDHVLARRRRRSNEISCGLSSFFWLLHFGHQLLVDVQPSVGVDDQRVGTQVACFAARLLRQTFDKRGAGDSPLTPLVNLRVDRFGNDFELFARCGAIHVDRYRWADGRPSLATPRASRSSSFCLSPETRP